MSLHLQHRLRSPITAACLLLAPLAATFVATPVAAQRMQGEPRIESVAIQSDAGLEPGATLRFDVNATPNARTASVRLGGSDVVVPLRERADGLYSGSHVVRRGDRLDADDRITVRIQHGDRTVAREFRYPPSFQARGPGAAPGALIERLVMRPMGQLRAGQELRFRLTGAPGGDAWLDIPGVVDRLDLNETRPGVYEGSYTIRRRDDLDAFRTAVATLRSGNQRATARLDLGGRDRDRDERDNAGRDREAPEVGAVSPADGTRVSERGNTPVGARYSDGRGGSGIDPASVRLRIGGRDVTRDARVTDDEVQYRADLPPGRYTADLRLADRAGNVTTKAWTFEVVAERAGGPVFVPGPGAAPVPVPPPVAQLPPLAGPLTVAVTSHAHNATVVDDGRLTLAGRTAPFAEVRVQVDSISNAPDTMGRPQKVLDQTVKADAGGNFEVPVTPSGFVIPGSRYDVTLSARYGNQAVSQRLTLHRRAA
jgi:hypothetical protein